MLPETTDVLVVGAGPTGLTLALTLARAGVRSVIIEKSPAPHTTSRAAVIHAHTLEVLERVGVAGDLVRHGLELERFGFYDRDRLLASIRFDRLPTRYPYLLMIPQDRTEAVLGEHLAAGGVVVHRGCGLEGVTTGGDGAEATVATPAGRRTIRARYVVGADGMRSVVRQAAGTSFTGSTYAESFVLADIDMEWDHGREDVKLFVSPEGPTVLAPLPDGRFRLVATVEEAPEHPDVALVQAILDARGPRRPGRVRDVTWSSRFRIHHRLADAYRHGPLFLVGDAAHVHSPAGGQGMNTGLVDAYTLGCLFRDTLVRGRPASDLDAYERLRRPAAAQVLKMAGLLTSVATLKGTAARRLRNAALSVIGHLPPVRDRIAMNLSGLSRRDATFLEPMPEPAPERSRAGGTAAEEPAATAGRTTSVRVAPRSGAHAAALPGD